MKQLLREKAEQAMQAHIPQFLGNYYPRTEFNQHVNSKTVSQALIRYAGEPHHHPLNPSRLKVIEAYYKEENDAEFDRVLSHHLNHIDSKTGKPSAEETISNHFEKEVVSIVNHLAMDLLIINYTEAIIKKEDFTKPRITIE